MFSLHEKIVAGYPNAGFDGFECYDLDELGSFVTQRVYSCCVFAGGSRGAKKFTGAYWCALDFDDTLTKQEALATLRGLRFLLAPSRNDGKEKIAKNGTGKPARDRFRVLIPFARVIYDRSIFEWNMKRVMRRFNSDPLPYDAGRVWQPSTCVENITHVGESLDVSDEIPVEETQAFKQQKIAQYVEDRKTMRVFPMRVQLFMAGQVEASSRNDELFKVACFLFQSGWTVEAMRDLVYSIPQMADHDKIESTLKSAAKTTGAAYF